MRMTALVCTLALMHIAAIPLHAQNTPTVIERDPEYELQSDQQSAPDALISLSKAAHLNIIADTTPEAAAPPLTISGRWRATLPQLVWNFGRAAGFSSHQINEKSWTLWRQPAIEILARRIVEGESVTRLESIPQIPAQNLAARKDVLIPLLSSVLYHAGWRADDSASWHAIDLSDLSEETRTIVGARIQDDLLPIWLGESRNSWLQDKFWDGARLRIVTPPRPPANSAAIVPNRILEIVGTPPTGGITGRPIGALDAP